LYNSKTCLLHAFNGGLSNSIVSYQYFHGIKRFP
jgi:hypothetical protein